MDKLEGMSARLGRVAVVPAYDGDDDEPLSDVDEDAMVSVRVCPCR